MRKSPYQLGQEARERDTNYDLNPFRIGTYKHEEWFDGWVDKEFDLWKKSGLTRKQWERYTGRILK